MIMQLSVYSFKQLNHAYSAKSAGCQPHDGVCTSPNSQNPPNARGLSRLPLSPFAFIFILSPSTLHLTFNYLIKLQFSITLE